MYSKYTALISSSFIHFLTAGSNAYIRSQKMVTLDRVRGYYVL